MSTQAYTTITQAMDERPRSEPILIGGGGIGGLSAAIALADAGFAVRVLERAPLFSEVGAGIQLGPNATRCLETWGVLSRLGRDLVRPSGIQILDAITGHDLATLPLGLEADDRYGAPYVVVRRADLQRALVEKAVTLSHIEIVLGFDVKTVETTRDGVTVHAADGRMAQGQALIAADGVFSALRATVSAAARPRYSGKSAWRATIPIEAAPEHAVGPWVCLWLAPRAHLVHYTVGGGGTLNVVAVVDDRWRGQGWSEPGDADDLMPHFSGWTGRPLETLRAAGGWRKWALFELPALPQWSAGPVALLGDAAHPVLPFLAQGAALAIEDAAALAQAVALAGGPTPAALRRYESGRRRRTARVQSAARRMGRIYHMSGPARWARNVVLHTRSPERLVRGLDWIYRYRVEDGG